jgi:hypothetical protein
VPFSGNLFSARDAETLVEAVNTATGCNITLLTSVERVAFAAHVQVQIVTHGRADLDELPQEQFAVIISYFG